MEAQLEDAPPEEALLFGPREGLASGSAAGGPQVARFPGVPLFPGLGQRKGEEEPAAHLVPLVWAGTHQSVYLHRGNLPQTQRDNVGQ